MNPSPPGGSHSRLWSLGLFAALGVLAVGLFRDVAAPWTDNIDANGACWSQSAHNTLRAGFIATAGVPSAFYFDPPPIPPDGYYTHHPPLLSLMLTGMFALFGEKEWVARMLPIGFSLAGVVLLWRLVQRCAGARAATLCAVLFAAMPMELHYGRMVNFEPIDLVWMLGALECLRCWKMTGAAGWRWLMLTAIVLALWTAWLGYLFVLAMSVHFFLTPGKQSHRLALLLLALMVASFCLFVLQVTRVQPEAWQEMMNAFDARVARSANPVPWGPWSVRMRDLLLAHIQPETWLLGIVGGVLVFRRRKTDAALRWLGWVALCFFGLSTLYVTLFRSASSIHDYASFYFTVPVAMMAGVALDRLLAWGESRGTGMKRALLAGTFALCAALAFIGERHTLALRRQFHILDLDKEEPAALIPELGRAIRDRFPEDSAVICNFMPSYGPQLHYYARHALLTYVFSPGEWKDVIADPSNGPMDGVIWLGATEAAEVLAALPPGSREDVTVAGIRFCFWHSK